MADETPISGTSLFGRSSASLAYLPGLDGLRALAVLAVLVYHAQQNMPSSWMPGGFLGVEVFFVISGYLITTLLISEHERSNRIDIKQFWVRRAKRLLPALFALLVVAMGIVGFGGAASDSLREHVRAFRGMWVSAWLYFTNWYQIIAGLNYADSTGRPPLLRHLWSLAVEEQFYLLWPLVMWWVLRRFRRRLPAVGATFLGLSVLVAVVTAITYQPENLWRINFLYLSTPTRASGLLLGSALAIFWRPWRVAAASVAQRGRTIDVLALIGLGVLAWAFLRWHFVTDGVYGPRGYDLLFRGGFLLVGVATALVIVAASHPGSVVGGRVLASRVLVWVGKRSYGLYLWHWPVFQLLRPRGDLSLLDPTHADINWSWFPTLLLRLVITVLITEASYRFVEMPVRGGMGFVRSRVTAGLAALALLVSVMPASATFNAPDVIADQAACNRDADSCAVDDADASPSAAEPLVDSVPDPEAAVWDSVVDSTVAVASSRTPVTTDQPVITEHASTTGNPTTTAEQATTAVEPTVVATTVAATAKPATVTVPAMAIQPLALGDSIMLGAKAKLEAAGIRVDAREGRRFGKAAGLINAYRKAGQIGEVVVLALGSNDNLSATLIDEILNKLTDVEHVIVVTPQVNGRSNEARNHRLLLAAADRFPNVTVLDWQRLAQSKLKYYWGGPYVKRRAQAYFWADRIHLAPAGQRYFTALIVQAVTQAVGSAPG